MKERSVQALLHPFRYLSRCWALRRPGAEPNIVEVVPVMALCQHRRCHRLLPAQQETDELHLGRHRQRPRVAHLHGRHPDRKKAHQEQHKAELKEVKVQAGKSHPQVDPTRRVNEVLEERTWNRRRPRSTRSRTRYSPGDFCARVQVLAADIAAWTACEARTPQKASSSFSRIDVAAQYLYHLRRSLTSVPPRRESLSRLLDRVHSFPLRPVVAAEVFEVWTAPEVV